jgi:glutathione synthase/RimK-type ligase-like ATP-grasp enzyme
MTILIISAPPDVHAQAVAKALDGMGARHELLDLSAFPQKLRLSMEYRGIDRRFRLRHEDGSPDISLSDVSSVWWRRPQGFKLSDAIADASARHFAASEMATAFQGLYQSMDAHWINEPARDVVAGHKPYQLRVAQDVGLEIPATLITNDPNAARAFWSEHPDQVIQKQFVAMPETWRETRRITATDMTLSQTIVHAPVLFQRNIEAVADLRVIMIGNQLFAAETRVDDQRYAQDVRMNFDARYAPHTLPEVVVQRLRALMARLGLVYGAVDLRLTPDGRYVFLEVNPAGQFLYIERDTQQPITEALARELMRDAA